MLTLQEVRHMKKLTLEDLKELDAEMIPPVVAAKFLGMDPYGLNLMARKNPEMVHFPFIVSGTRVKFSRRGLIAWAEGRGT